MKNVSSKMTKTIIRLLQNAIDVKRPLIKCKGTDSVSIAHQILDARQCILMLEGHIKKTKLDIQNVIEMIKVGIEVESISVTAYELLETRDQALDCRLLTLNPDAFLAEAYKYIQRGLTIN